MEHPPTPAPAPPSKVVFQKTKGLTLSKASTMYVRATNGIHFIIPEAPLL